MAQKPELNNGQRVATWIVDGKLGAGTFGDVYQVRNSAGQIFAMKTEKIDQTESSVLKIEVHVLQYLNRTNSKHFCKLEDTGTVSKFRYIVMTLAGPSLCLLRSLKPEGKQNFSMGCALSVGIKCVEAISELHSLVGILHRDIKPGNFAIGRSDVRQVFMLDFGMARNFLGPDRNVLPPRLYCGFRGTVRYASISCHIARELCRKDDLESWLYMQIELTKGLLPWRELTEKDDVCKFKERCRTQIISQNILFGGCPKEYIDIMRYIDSLRYYDEPDYSKVIGLLKNALLANNLKEYPYDWELK